VSAAQLPAVLEAHEPPEARGAGRDDVRLLVASRGDGRLVHARFPELPRFLRPGDLLVINVSATLPAALAARRADGTPVRVHASMPAPGAAGDGRCWIVELRSADGASPYRGGRDGERVELAGGAALTLLAPYAGGQRLWLARVDGAEPLDAILARHGEPIRYGYVAERWPLAAYQTVYALEPGSAEMPSAGRPLTPELVTRLVAGGVQVAPLVLHAGVSSPERHEAPFPERFRVPPATATAVNAVRAAGGRVVAVGTTVVRALETVAAPGGRAIAGEGLTDLVITPERGVRVVDGLLTGWHEPEASHLLMLEAIAGRPLLDASYDAAREAGYRWHEFGDSHLILP
jgi:S-adenosylmethionine:tRNA ribosyltransferase-isomerase